jgi:CHAT domain-containing protein
MQEAKIIHFATHGLLVRDSIFTTGVISGSLSYDLPPGAIALTENPSAKAIVMRGMDMELPFNGFLTSAKIMLLSLDAELVALSACDTA